MGFMHIPNLESDSRILNFKVVYASEKIHGTSAHIKWSPEDGITFFSGGEKYEKFVALFDEEKLSALFRDKFQGDVTVFGEAYGGSQQGMGNTYGPSLKFVVFAVKIGDVWLDMDKAENVALALGLEFVYYELIPTTQEALDKARDRMSEQAKRNDMGDDKIAEGVVLTPPFEVRLNNSQRLIAKYKREEFAERRKTSKVLDPEKQTVLKNAGLVAFEYVNRMRLEHVINRLVSEREDKSVSMTDTGELIKLMIEDVLREGDNVPDTPVIKKAIGQQTVKELKHYLGDKLRETLNEN